MVDAAIGAAELAVLFLASLVLWRLPRGVSNLAIGLAAWSLARALSPERYGAEVVEGGRTAMAAAVFADPSAGVDHGVTVAQVPLPDPSSGQILVRVQAAGLNPSNFKINMARIPFARHLKAPVVGYDCAGVALSVGSDCAGGGIAVGDEIYGFAGGSIAEFAVLDCAKAAKKPRSLTPSEAAGLPVAALTSLMALERSGVREGHRVLVLGASGGCGVFGVALAKLKGAHVTGVCSTKNVDFVRSLGADSVVDYRNEEEMAALVAAGAEFDVIYDTVTSFAPEDPDYEPSMRPLLRHGHAGKQRHQENVGTRDTDQKSSGYDEVVTAIEGDRYVAINGAQSDWRNMMLEQFIIRPLGLDWRVQRPGYDLFLLSPTKASLESLASMFDAVDLKLPDGFIEARYPLSGVDLVEDTVQLHAAFEKMKSRRTRGKIVFELPGAVGTAAGGAGR